MVESWRDYERSREAVWELTRSDDTEAAARARWILDRWEIGLMPELPAEIQQQLARAQVDPAAAISVLIDGGYLREAVEVARHHQLARSSEELQQQIAQVVAVRYPQLIYQGVREDEIDIVLELLEYACEYESLVAARAVLLDRLGRSLTIENVLPASTDDWPASRRDQAAARALATAGRLEAAAAVGASAERADLESSVALVARDWRRLAEIAEQATDPNMPVRATVLQYATWLVAAEQAGLSDQADQAAEALRGADIQLDLRWRSLLVAGRIDDALAVARQLNPDGAADILNGQQRLTEAFAVAGISPSQPLGDVRRLIDAAFDRSEKADRAEQPFGPPARDRSSLRTVLTAVRLLRAAGANHELEAALRHLGAVDNDASGSWDGARVAATLAHRYELSELASDVLAEVASPISQEVGYPMGHLFTDGHPDVFRAVAQAVVTMRAELDTRDHWLTTLQLVGGVLPPGWDAQADLDTLYDRAIRTELPGVLRTKVGPSFKLGDIFASLGRGDLAEQAYRAAALDGDTETLLRYADRLLLRGEAERALEIYRVGFENVLRPSRTSTFNSRSAREFANSAAFGALAGQAAALQAMGHTDEAEMALRALELMPFNPLDDQPEAYFERLRQCGFAGRQLEFAPYSLRYAVFDRDGAPDRFYTDAMKLAGQLEESDPRAAAGWWRIALIGSLSRDVLYANGYLQVVAQWRVLDGLAALRGGELTAASTALHDSLRYFPLNIDMAEKQLVKLRQRGHEALADSLLDEILARGRRYVAENPRDANTFNNLAWVAALNERADEGALDWARQAVLLVPDSTSYRDTLAEVLFRLGRQSEAVAVERQCLLDEPDDWHLHEQLARFSQPE
jgi:hypothetical protein